MTELEWVLVVIAFGLLFVHFTKKVNSVHAAHLKESIRQSKVISKGMEVQLILIEGINETRRQQAEFQANVKADLEEFEEMLNEEPSEHDGKLALNALSIRYRWN